MKYRGHLLACLSVGLIAVSSPYEVIAQDLEDQIEAELDSMGGAPSSGNDADELSLDEEFASDVQAPAVSGEVSQSIANSTPINDAPNTELERLFKIFSQSQPVSPGRWQEIVGRRTTESYAIQAGDTLWDISQTMFGDGFFWSKLWAENSRLENPHRIAVGQAIRFVAGNESSAPMISVAPVDSTLPMIQAANAAMSAESDVVSGKGDALVTLNSLRQFQGPAPVYRENAMHEFTPEELARGDVAELEELIPTPEIPPGKTSRSVLKKLPPSFVSQIIPNAETYDSTGLQVGARPAFTMPATVVPNSYILEKLPDGVGKIEEIEVGQTVASLGQYVLLRMSRTVNPGQKFSVVFPREKIKDPVRGEIGPVMEVGGVVEIVSQVQADVYRANVTMNMNPIRVGSIVIEEELPKTTFGRRGSRAGVDARIIGGEFDESRKQFGENSVVYLDGGSNTGVSVGDILPVVAQRSVRRPSSKVPDWRKTIGLLKVVKVENSVSTAFVLEAREEILPGDRTGAEMLESGSGVKVEETQQETELQLE